MTWWRMIGVALLIGLTGCQPPAPSEPETGADATVAPIEGDMAQASYSMGYMIASNMDDQFAGDLDRKAFVTGLQDRFAGQDRQVSEADAERALAVLRQKQEAAVAASSNDNLQAGNEFLAENGKREGVTTTASGLQYEVLVAADGEKPAATDTVTTHYHGTLIDGKVFDSSVVRGTPASFPLDRVIPGWTEALQLMPVGSKWRLYIPPGLAYGSRAAGEIPPNSTLIFDVELLGINDAN